jgi:hypothetical protein
MTVEFGRPGRRGSAGRPVLVGWSLIPTLHTPAHGQWASTMQAGGARMAARLARMEDDPV